MEVNTKSQPITKEQVWLAYKEVRKHGKTAGVDGLTLEAFDRTKGKELYKVWNRMASGSYHPSPVKRVEIPKPNGESRGLGIPTIGDRVAQTVVKRYLEPILEPFFHRYSFGYRPGKGAHGAIEQASDQCWKKPWVIDLDIKGFFDNLGHDLIMKALERHTNEKWVLMYIWRWLRAPIQFASGELVYPEKGSPQGGVISPLLANLYLHYAFDRWMEINFGDIVFERYADDIVVHCWSRQQAEHLLGAIRSRLKECGLRLHPEKTKIVYCKTTNRRERFENVTFDFLGVTFRPKVAMNTRSGEKFTAFGPAAISRGSLKKIVGTIRSKQLLKRTTTDLSELALLLARQVRGWINYYGKVNMRLLQKVMRYLNEQLLRWVMKRYKRFRGRVRSARKWLQMICRKSPELFVHWKYGFRP